MAERTFGTSTPAARKGSPTARRASGRWKARGRYAATASMLGTPSDRRYACASRRESTSQSRMAGWERAREMGIRRSSKCSSTASGILIPARLGAGGYDWGGARREGTSKTSPGRGCRLGTGFKSPVRRTTAAAGATPVADSVCHWAGEMHGLERRRPSRSRVTQLRKASTKEAQLNTKMKGSGVTVGCLEARIEVCALLLGTGSEDGDPGVGRRSCRDGATHRTVRPATEARGDSWRPTAWVAGSMAMHTAHSSRTTPRFGHRRRQTSGPIEKK